MFRVLYCNKKGGKRLPFYIWYGRQDLNLHGNPLEPKSNVSANSTTPAYISLIAYLFRLGCPAVALSINRLRCPPTPAHAYALLHLPQAAQSNAATTSAYINLAYSITQPNSCQREYDLYHLHKKHPDSPNFCANLLDIPAVHQ